MPTRTVTMLLGAALAAVIAQPTAARAAEAVSLLSVQSGHSVMIQTHGLTRVAVGDGRIAGVLPIVPDSPMPLIPSGVNGEGVTV